MKRTLLLAALVPLSALMSPLLAQGTAAPERLQPVPAPGTSRLPVAEPEVNLIPEQIPSSAKRAPAEKPEPAEPQAGKKSKTEENAEELLVRIHLREARTKVLREPAVQAEWDRAMKAKTDLGKREAMKSYYALLYARIVKFDPSVKKLAELRQASAIRRFEQTRLDPTEPLDADERADRFARSLGE